MANRNAALRADSSAAKAWRAFLRDATPSKRATQAAAQAHGVPNGSVERLTFAHSSSATSSRRRRSKNGAIPDNPWTVWEEARALRTLGAPCAWCAGPLFLLAAGYYDLFAAVFLETDDTVDVERCIELLSNADGALRPNPSPELLESIVAQRVSAVSSHDSWSPAVKREVVNELEQLAKRYPPERSDRNIWILKPEEAGAFTAALERVVPRRPELKLVGESPAAAASLPPTKKTGPRPVSRLDPIVQDSPALVAAILVTNNPEIGPEMQRHLTISALLSEFAQIRPQPAAVTKIGAGLRMISRFAPHGYSA